ncbi:MAG TPA: ABC-F family ATP-binding cassette domain-containing protein [Candidatus Margulisiibacteriota bacterium]|nr:ABC-F family ATP-binding cassette domain-containing protein [Candidatus Margulisiibacteriota bacterium]
MLTITGLKKRYGSQVVLDGLNWFVPDGARVGLVGANGSGKSTLLRIVAGEVEPDDGSIVVPKDGTVGYLPQEVFGLSGRTVLEQALTAFAAVRALEAECRRVEHELAEVPVDDPRHEQLMETYTHLRSEWDTHGSYDMEAQAERVLAGLGFRQTDLHRDCSEFSGGWQMRLALATLLLRRPQLLLLDEPTNHLDIEARNWLEEFLADYPYTVIVVAHDRYFLDVVVQQISEVSHGSVTDFKTNYSRYLVEREERWERQAEAYRLQQEEIERLQAFISRFRYQASKAALVQSRIKQLDKIERLQLPEGFRTVHFRFPQPPRSGRVVLALHGAHKQFGDHVVYDGLDLTIERGRKVALVGPNGAGKSTLTKLLAGVEPLGRGERVVGHNVTLGYFAQDQTQVLDPTRTVLEEITRAAPPDLVPQVRNILGAFLFSGDAVNKRTSVLSGGERNRLALAKLLLHPANCLLLDEPTNHLDIHAKEVLLDALLAYTGTLVLVAHDRYILDRLPEEIIEVGAGTAVRYLGNYEDYLRKKAAGETAPLPRFTADERDNGARPVSPNVADRAAQRRREREQARRAQQLEQIEAAISTKEAELGTLTAALNHPDFHQTHSNPHSLYSDYARLRKEIEALYGQLERLESAAPDALAS